MKQIKLPTLFCAGLLVAGLPAAAQTLPEAAAYIDIGAIRAPHHVKGDLWWLPTSSSVAGLEFPKGDTNNLRGFFAAQLYGRTASGQVRYSGNIYRNPGSDYSPGPVVTGNAAVLAANAAAWNRIWKLNKSTVDSFIAERGTAGLPNVPKDILEWPAKGNKYAKGANNTTLTIDHDLAPFIDVNQDGVYNPLEGDYPWIKGDQMLWWVMNDNTQRLCGGSTPLNAEIAVTAYAFSGDAAHSNSIFYEYDIQNKSDALDSFRFGGYADMDIQYAFDDLGGYDTSSRLGVIYNSTAIDPSSDHVTSAGGVVFLDQPGDLFGSYAKMQNFFTKWVGGGTPNYDCQSIPAQLTQQYSASANGFDTIDYECRTGAKAGDRRITFSTNSLPLAVNGKAHFAFALVAHDNAGACHELHLDQIQLVADTAIVTYWANRKPPRPIPIATSVSMSKRTQSSVYPNPVTNTLFVRSATQVLDVRVTNALGATIGLPQKATPAGMELNAASLVPGIYYIRIHTAAGAETVPFVRQ